ncbi:unnamed protein product [Timema podura]|uniref:Carboxylesterase type B domain-containing protein n=1 Tax=Timema podura TaxID=61482 RepID=A0ABN7NMZ6_TIMPD|nr:unnamed protein product [Timema podura]
MYGFSIAIFIHLLAFVYLRVEDVETVVVQTDRGSLRGSSKISAVGNKYYSFQGIPYAKPPLGNLRFKSPREPDPWEGVRDVIKEKPSCVQATLILGNIIGSEDCLYLNVYTTQLANGSDSVAPKPVMVWIHGGAWQTGSGSPSMYGPDYLLEEGVVVVTINYRLGVIGFLSVNGSDVSGNAGLKDQVAALRWVKANIAQFGGDPDGVTIFGESAGGAAVHYHLLSPLSEGLFQRAISQSGSATNPTAFFDSTHERAFRLGKALGHQTSDSQNLVDFFRSVPINTLVSNQNKGLTEQESERPLAASFIPTTEYPVKGEDVFLPDSPWKLLESGQFKKLPFITGINRDEGIVTVLSVVHGDELGYIFYKKGLQDSLDPNSTEMKVLNRMVKMWTNFAKTGDPSEGMDVIWKPVTSKSRNYLSINEDSTLLQDLEKERMAFWDEEVALRVSHSPVMSSDRMKPRLWDWAAMIDFLEEAAITSLSNGSKCKVYITQTVVSDTLANMHIALTPNSINTFHTWTHWTGQVAPLPTTRLVWIGDHSYSLEALISKIPGQKKLNPNPSKGAAAFLSHMLPKLFRHMCHTAGQPKNEAETVTVTTSQGILRGSVNTSSIGQQYYSFQGIRYAQPPVGPLRFKIPLSSDESELLPVMVWIHGGAFQSGSGSASFYGPDYLLGEGVIVVTFNYRLGVLGFLSVNDSDVAGNAGLKDQVAALRWVNANIARFGGNPNKVTIFGESAGGAGIHYQVLSPLSEGLFHQAISQSGAAINPTAFSESTNERAFRLGSALGLKTNDGQKLVDFFRTLSAAQLIASQNKGLTEEESEKALAAAFIPTTEFKVKGEDTFLPDAPWKLLKSGQFKKIPYITGVNQNEGFIGLMGISTPAQLNKTLNDFERVLPFNLGLKKGSKMSLQVAEKVKQFYFGDRPITLQSIYDFVDLQTDIMYAGGCHRVTNQSLAHSANSIYNYQFTYSGRLNQHKSGDEIIKGIRKVIFIGSVPTFAQREENHFGKITLSTPNRDLNLDLVICSLVYCDSTVLDHAATEVVVMHGDDLNYIFYKPGLLDTLSEDSTEMKVLHQIVKMWTNFAKTGNPSKEMDVIWAPATKSNRYFLRIDANLTQQKDLEKQRMAFWDEIYLNLGL